jgi:exodeoxyribonuclease-1
MPIEIAGPSAAGYELQMDELARRATVVRNDARLRSRLVAAVLAGRIPFDESPHVEEQIYRGFYSRSDQALIDEFHRADWPRRWELTAVFADPRLRTLSRRLVYCEAPDVMPPGVRAGYTRAIATRLCSRSEATGRWTTFSPCRTR